MDTTPGSISAELGSDLWQSIAHAIPDRLLLVDREGKIVYANRARAGGSASGLLGRNALDYVPPGSRVELEESLRQIFEGGAARSREQRVIYADGAEAWYATHTGPVMVGDQVVAAVIVARDITDIKRAQFALAESEARYRTLVEYAPEAIVMFDVDSCNFVEVNENACTLFGLTRDELLAANPFTMNPALQPDGRRSDEVAWEHIAAALAGEVPCFEWLYRRSDGAEIYCEIRLVQMPSLERRLIRGSVTDVTQHHKLEQQIRQWQRMDALGQLAGGIAHDFNNVLTTILASADLLTTDLKEEEPRADAQAIVTAARHGAALVSQLLTFARRQTTVVSEALDMNDVAREMATITRRLLGPDITLILELKSAEALARVDRSNAEQVVMNLLMNARDAITGSGSIYLTVAANRGGSRYTMLRVRDTGSGMTPEVQQRMFEPFFTTKGGKGTGLGLSTVYGIVTQAGGTLDVKTAVGVGTTIDVLLPGE